LNSFDTNDGAVNEKAEWQWRTTKKSINVLIFKVKNFGNKAGPK
jgi:hypothetical protein